MGVGHLLVVVEEQAKVRAEQEKERALLEQQLAAERAQRQQDNAAIRKLELDLIAAKQVRVDARRCVLPSVCPSFQPDVRLT